MVEGRNRAWRLRRRPVGPVREGDLELVEEPLPELEPGQALCRTGYLSLDPTNRIWMSDRPQYMPPVELGMVMRGSSVGRVVASRGGLPEGAWVAGRLSGWQEYFVVDAERTRPLPLHGLDPHVYLGALGLTGVTAYFGLLDIGGPQAGETVVVSAAAGAVGSVAGQLAKAHGCRAVGIAGGPEKCRYVVEELGFDACIDRKAEDVDARLGELCPDGIDIDFENAGGPILDACLRHLALRARIVLCGLIAGYNADGAAVGPKHFDMVLMRRARVEGFIVSDYAPRWGEAREALAGWLADGTITHRAEIVDGLENAPAALEKLFSGDKLGKLVVRV